MALVQKAFSDIITFSRSSNATRIGPTGLVEYAPHNLLLQSQTFDNASWLKSNSSITANAIAAPDGTVTADKLVEAATTSVHSATQAVTFAANFIYTASVYAKAGERSFLIIQPTGDSRFAYYNLSNGTVGTVSGSPLSTQIQSVGNNWYRCTITVTSPGATAANCILYSAATDGNATYTGDGTSGIYLWGAQLAVGPYALDYTPTTSAAVYGPRFDFDPVTLAARGLLVEEQRTNLVNYSTVAFIGSQWQQYGSAVLTENYSVAPDGTITAGRILSSGFGTVRIGTSNLTNGTNYAASIWLKSNTGSNYSISLEIGDTLVGTFTVTPTWQRFSGVGTPFLTGYNFIDLETAATLDISVWGCQIEQGGFATSLIPTSGSTVTRSADVASVDTLSPWFNATEGTFLSNVSPLAIDNDISLSASDSGGYANSMYLPADSGAQFIVVNSSVVEAQIDAGTILANTPNKIAAAYAANNFALSVNGGAVVTDTSGAIPTVDRLVLGGLEGNTANRLNGHLRQVAYYPRRLTNAELQALSA